jgi:hypothetical protein
MSTIHLHQTTTSTPEQFIARLTDFGPGRAKLFGNSTDDYLKVHRQGPKEADVTEGSNGIWERLHYDWSNPNRAVVVRDGKNIKGRLLGFVLEIFGTRVLGKELAKTVKAIEARSNGSRAAKLA